MRVYPYPFLPADGPIPAVPNEYVDAIPPPVLNDGGSPSKNPLPPPDMFQDDGKPAAASGAFRDFFTTVLLCR